jgi:hypothetical protein
VIILLYGRSGSGKLQRNQASVLSSTTTMTTTTIREGNRGKVDKQRLSGGESILSSPVSQIGEEAKFVDKLSPPAVPSVGKGDTRARLMLQRKLQERDTQAEENATLVKHLKQQVCELQQALEEGFEAHSKQDEGLRRAQARITELEGHLRVIGAAKREVEAELAQRDVEVEQLCDAVDDREERINELKEMLRRVLESNERASLKVPEVACLDEGEAVMAEEKYDAISPGNTSQENLAAATPPRRKSLSTKAKKKNEEEPIALRRSPRKNKKQAS